MARNEEKALTLFNKWQTFKADFHSVRSNRRPFVANECDSLPDAEKWRRELVTNITKNITAIRNASLGEHRIRELNDEINKYMKQKYYWEIRIRELGGNVPLKNSYDLEGKELPGAPGYRYYGAAKELPGVRELFAEQEHEETLRQQKASQKRSRKELYENITPVYYGELSSTEEEELMELEVQHEQYLGSQRNAPKSYQEILQEQGEIEELENLLSISQEYWQKQQPITTQGQTKLIGKEHQGVEKVVDDGKIVAQRKEEKLKELTGNKNAEEPDEAAPNEDNILVSKSNLLNRLDAFF